MKYRPRRPVQVNTRRRVLGFQDTAGGDLVGRALVAPHSLSYRDLEEILAERGIDADRATLYRWVQGFTTAPDRHDTPVSPRAGEHCHLD